MGKPAWGNACAAGDEHIVAGREPRELKHLSTQRKREYFPSSGERKGSSPNRPCLHGRGCRAWHMEVINQSVSGMVWESLPKRVIAPYAKTD